MGFVLVFLSACTVYQLLYGLISLAILFAIPTYIVFKKLVDQKELRAVKREYL